jgi:hypothetical protein
MILLTFALAQVAAPEPELQKDVAQISGPSFTAEIAPMVNEYHSCLMPPEGITWTAESTVSWEEMFRDRIADCADVRRSAVSAATKAFRPIPGGETRAKVYVNRTFDAIDETLIRTTQLLTDEIETQSLNKAQSDYQAPKSETEKQ